MVIISLNMHRSTHSLHCVIKKNGSILILSLYGVEFNQMTLRKKRCIFVYPVEEFEKAPWSCLNSETPVSIWSRCMYVLLSTPTWGERCQMELSVLGEDYRIREATSSKMIRYYWHDLRKETVIRSMEPARREYRQAR